MTASKDNGRPESSAKSANLALVREIAESFRRVRGDESYDEGIRTIWHQSKMRTEMLSWEDQKGTIMVAFVLLAVAGVLLGLGAGLLLW